MFEYFSSLVTTSKKDKYLHAAPSIVYLKSFKSKIMRMWTNGQVNVSVTTMKYDHYNFDHTMEHVYDRAVHTVLISMNSS